MKSDIIEVLYYFSFFSYPPTAEEIYLFLKKPTSFGRFLGILEKMVKQGDIKSWKIDNGRLKIDSEKLRIENRKENQIKSTLNWLFSTFKNPRYTIQEYGKKYIKNQILKIKNKKSNQKTTINNYKKRYQASVKKLSGWRFQLYLKVLSLLPQIRLVGLSGSIAMMNAKESDDIDLFIITAKNRLFTGRFIALLLAQLLGLRRKREKNRSRFTFHVSRYTNKVCLNLFFDQSALSVPQFKHSEYVAHEVLQMKPIINKSQTYEKFLEANWWVRKIFPNASWTSSKFKVQSSKLQSKIKNFKFLTVILNLSFLTFNLIGGWFELILKKFQLFFINRHRTTEIITDFQLWFHPKDFGRRISNIG